MRTTVVCEGAPHHRPAYFETDAHHVYPKFLAALLHVPTRTETVPLCSGCHDNVHHLIRHLINDGSISGHHAPPTSRALALRAHDWWVTSSLSADA